MSGDLRALAEAADGGWGPDGWYAEHELRHGLRGTSTDLDADVAYLRAASPDAILALLDERDALAAKVARVERVWHSWFGVGWPDAEDIAALEADLRAALGDNP